MSAVIIATSAMLMANAAHNAARMGQATESVPATPEEQAALLVCIPIALLLGIIAGVKLGDPFMGDHWVIGVAAGVMSWLLMALGVAIYYQ